MVTCARCGEQTKADLLNAALVSDVDPTVDGGMTQVALCRANGCAQAVLGPDALPALWEGLEARARAIEDERAAEQAEADRLDRERAAAMQAEAERQRAIAAADDEAEAERRRQVDASASPYNPDSQDAKAHPLPVIVDPRTGRASGTLRP